MNDLAIHHIVQFLEVRNIQTANSLYRQINHLIGSARDPRALQTCSLSAQRAENPCAIKPLAFAMGTEAHGHELYRDVQRRASMSLRAGALAIPFCYHSAQRGREKR